MTDNAGRSGSEPIVNRGWRVTLAGLGINLALGILYTWSVIRQAIETEWGWSKSASGWPYSIACLTFAFLMVPAGRLQDRMGPRLAASIGGVLVGAGMIVAGLSGMIWGAGSYWGYVLGFGLLAGAGIGFGYAAATPPAVKWFPPSRTGMIAGIVVAGFGLASVYAAPLAKLLLSTVGLTGTMVGLGIAFLIVVVGLAQLLTPPPKDYLPAGSSPSAGAAAVARKKDFAPKEMCSTMQFYLLWFMYACGAGAGLMIISSLSTLGKVQAGIDLGFVLVAALAVGNGAGRVVAGSLSDKLGRLQTMLGCFLVQAFLMVLLTFAQAGTVLATVPALALVSALIGANYGANLALFPSVTKDYYGLKNFGVNYGLVFTALGAGGFVLAQLQAYLYDAYKTFSYSCYVAAALLVVAAAATFAVKSPAVESQPREEPVAAAVGEEA
jgi:OFA family oxalate/formate antiporter-like MFS transporter